MKSFHILVQAWGGGSPVPGPKAAFATVLLAVCLGATGAAHGQVVPAADRGGLTLSAGGMASGYYVQYGKVKLLGAAAFVDADTRRHIGIEGEARWLDFHQTNDIHDSTYMAGPRYHREVGRFQPYVKGLVGVGHFNFPYNYAKGNYLVVAPGGGVDFRLNHRIQIRVADFEYQIWPQFTYGQMSSVGVSSGIRVRLF
jgi:hypothetical protein